MNRTTDWEHIGYAVAMQAIVALIAGDWWTGAAFGAAFFLGREHAQAEYRYIAANGGDRYNTPTRPEWAVLIERRWWSLDSVLDWAMPAAAVCLVAMMSGA